MSSSPESQLVALYPVGRTATMVVAEVSAAQSDDLFKRLPELATVREALCSSISGLTSLESIDGTSRDGESLLECGTSSSGDFLVIAGQAPMGEAPFFHLCWDVFWLAFSLGLITGLLLLCCHRHYLLRSIAPQSGASPREETWQGNRVGASEHAWKENRPLVQPRSTPDPPLSRTKPCQRAKELPKATTLPSPDVMKERRASPPAPSPSANGVLHDPLPDSTAHSTAPLPNARARISAPGRRSGWKGQYADRMARAREGRNGRGTGNHWDADARDVSYDEQEDLDQPDGRYENGYSYHQRTGNGGRDGWFGEEALRSPADLYRTGSAYDPSLKINTACAHDYYTQDTNHLYSVHPRSVVPRHFRQDGGAGGGDLDARAVQSISQRL